MSGEQSSGGDAAARINDVDENLQEVVEILDDIEGVGGQEKFERSETLIVDSREALSALRQSDLSAEQEETVAVAAEVLDVVDMLHDIEAVGEQIGREFEQTIEAMGATIENPEQFEEEKATIERLDGQIDAHEGEFRGAKYKYEDIDDDALAHLSALETDTLESYIEGLAGEIDQANLSVTGFRLYFESLAEFLEIMQRVAQAGVGQEFDAGLDEAEREIASDVEDAADLAIAADATFRHLQETTDEELAEIADMREESQEVKAALGAMEEMFYALKYGNLERAEAKFREFEAIAN